LVTRSNDFSNSVWAGYCGVKSNITYNTTDVVAPDGLFTSTKVARGSNGCDGSLAWGFRWNSGIGGTIINTTDTYTASIWARGLVGGEVINVGFNDSQMTNHTLSTSWTRITRVGVANTTDRGFQVKSDTINQTFYIWGAQLEQGSFPTSYIPTTASTVTRTADNASMTGSNLNSFYNKIEGSIIANISLPNDISLRGSATTGIMGISRYDLNFAGFDGYGLTVRVDTRLFSSSNRVIDESKNVNVSMTGPITSNTLQQNTLYKTSLFYANNELGLCIGNTGYIATVADENYGLYPDKTHFYIGQTKHGGSPPYTLGGHISQLTYYPSRLPNQQLINLTK
jgi:hypothetical protein